ncbi:GLUG motif-containing protein [Sediminispirochaeta smaragdinae]|uniref:GLUG domain protein n=1 Tax=Sediminispirochaeta smaragdinae (strain DSM 11293 / JCM 15392 / SEBR 4228) TaxID=573413 RepID=E1R2Q7_SEDSS|nr:GLUG motif-containing protein [Sediminispirochaeta smaragdinae]ADK80339.1 GLUG domain protein [Sediminispirochaeta smaragdinae DSM 11293]
MRKLVIYTVGVFLSLLLAVSCSNPTNSDSGSPFIEEPGDGSPANPYRISTAEQLSAVRGGQTGYEDWTLSDCYKLTADIDLSGYTTGAGWDPIGEAGNSFTGSFDGNGHKITGLTIYGTENYQGLFRSIDSSGSISNLGIENVNVIGPRYVGALAGTSKGTITHCYSTGMVIADERFGGGLVGGMTGGTISQCYSSASVSGEERIGGLIGYIDQLVTISESYATGPVKTTSSIGSFKGGFVGILLKDASGSITNCYATGDVNGANYLAGFVGSIVDASLFIKNCYATGKIIGSESASHLGGFSGSPGNIDSCYYDTQTTGKNDTIGAAGVSTADMKTQSTFSGWDFDTVWAINADEYPHL